MNKIWEIRTTAQPEGTPVLQDIQYIWDPAGNLTQREDQVSTETETFSYDYLDRLTSVSGPYTETFTYDEIGNLTSKNGASYTYGENGAGPHAVTSIDQASYTYDSNGNMESGDGRVIAWDVENRPVSVIKDGITTTFVYDGDGNRIIQEVNDGQTITTTIYVNQYYEKTGTEITTSYYLGSKLIAMKKGEDLSYIHQDHLGSTSVTSDTAGEQESIISYLPFGSIRASSGTLPTDRLFTGQRLDDYTGIYYYNARYYDPSIGRFISPDTIAPDPYNPQSLNRYSYCLNNPLKYIDPSGHDPLSYEPPPDDYQPPREPPSSTSNSSSLLTYEAPPDNYSPPCLNFFSFILSIQFSNRADLRDLGIEKKMILSPSNLDAYPAPVNEIDGQVEVWYVRENSPIDLFMQKNLGNALGVSLGPKCILVSERSGTDPARELLPHELYHQAEQRQTVFYPRWYIRYGIEVSKSYYESPSEKRAREYASNYWTSHQVSP